MKSHQLKNVEKLFYKDEKKTLIYGGGAIGSYLAACLLNSKHQIFF